MNIHDILRNYITSLTCTLSESEKVGALVDLLGGTVARAENLGMENLEPYKRYLSADRVPGAGELMLTDAIVDLTTQSLKHVGYDVFAKIQPPPKKSLWEKIFGWKLFDRS